MNKACQKSLAELKDEALTWLAVWDADDKDNPLRPARRFAHPEQTADPEELKYVTHGKRTLCQSSRWLHLLEVETRSQSRGRYLNEHVDAKRYIYFDGEVFTAYSASENTSLA